MKNIIFCFCATILLISSCKKETTVIKEEKYTPPQPVLYGTWKLIDPDTFFKNVATYYTFTSDGSNFAYGLNQDNYGFKSKTSYVYSATEKQLNLSNNLYNYNVHHDTLSLISSPTSYTQYIKVKDPVINQNTWTNTITVLKTLEVPRSIGILSVAIDADFLYISGNRGSANYVYKFNTLTLQWEDSISMEFSSILVSPPYIYYGMNSSGEILKTTGLQLPSTKVSLNNIYNIKNISMNKATGDIFVYTFDSKLYSGKEGTNFNQSFDFSKIYIHSALYFKNDEFLVRQFNIISKIKIAPDFKVITSYDPIPNFNLNSIYPNGDDIWLFGYSYLTGTLQCLKVRLN